MLFPFRFSRASEASSDEGLKEIPKSPECGAVPKSKASAHSPTERMKAIPPPSAPTRFSSAKKAGHAGEDHPMMHYAVRGAWICHTGRVRRANEDSCIAGQEFSRASSENPTSISIGSGPWIVAVSDGIGGHLGGAEASREVVRGLAECQRVTPLSICEILQRLNRRLCERGVKEPELAAMGATVAGIGCGGRGVFAFNVGDSRVYRMHGKRLVQLTRDDSEAEDLIDQGLLERNEGARPGFLHALTQAIGGREEVVDVEVHVHSLHVEQPSRYLICTDGLTDMVISADIEDILVRECDAEAAATALFEKAMKAGGVDNITVAVIEIEKMQP
jgi:PPM family protein phosphatase